MTRTRILIALPLALGGCAVTGQHNEKPHQTGGQRGQGTIVVNVGSNPASKTPDHTVTVPKVILGQQARQNEDTGSKGEQPKGMTQADAVANEAVQKVLAVKDLLPLNLPFAAPSQPGCRTHFVRNYSSRNRIAPHLIVIHWTGSANTGNWNDVDSIVAWFDDPRAQASSNYTIDSGGRCVYMVPETAKAWTQAAANPFSVSIEVVHPGGPNEPFCPGACLRKLGRVVSDISRRWKIPLRRGATQNCTPVRSGVIDHKSLGTCGGGHPDVGPFALDPIIAAAKTFARKQPRAWKPSRSDVRLCALINNWRHAGRHHAGRKRATERKRRLSRRGVICTRSGPLRTRR